MVAHAKPDGGAVIRLDLPFCINEYMSDRRCTIGQLPSLDSDIRGTRLNVVTMKHLTAPKSIHLIRSAYKMESLMAAKTFV